MGWDLYLSFRSASLATYEVASLRLASPALFLVALVGVLYLKTRPAPILTVMTWPGAYGRAQATAQMHPYAAAKNVDVRTALWDGDLAEVAAMVKNRAYKADVIDFELPTAVKACNQHLLERIDASVLPPGKDGTPASRDFVAGAIGPCWVGGMVYSQVMVYAPDLKQTPATLADFFDRRKISRPPGAQPGERQVQPGTGPAGRWRGAG
jgi:putative spermidine/putrescine transport system substrate-binding protein